MVRHCCCLLTGIVTVFFETMPRADVDAAAVRLFQDDYVSPPPYATPRAILRPLRCRH